MAVTLRSNTHFLSYNFLLNREIQEKRKELERQKTEYQEGMWNVNSILLGGLGRDPLHEGIII